MAKPQSPSSQQLPLQLNGSNTFGRYQKISNAQTFNMILSDDWLVPFAGSNYVDLIGSLGGRGLYASVGLNAMVAVVDNGIYTINAGLEVLRIGSMATFGGDVFIAENNAQQIAICDKQNIYILDYSSGSGHLSVANTTGWLPGYVSFQDTRFVSVDLLTNQWRLSNNNDGTTWPADSFHVGSFQTKADMPLAALPMPSKGNQLLIMGSVVTESWYDAGLQLFPYQRNSFSNIDYGCLNSATIASNESMIVWLAGNSVSGPVILVTDGQGIEQISNDGINFKFAELTNPKDSYGFLFKQDGHLIYVITFVTDNLTYAYDFNTKKFFTLTDQNLNYHPARKVVAFNNTYYYVSTNDGNLYEFNSQFTAFNTIDKNGNPLIWEIPRIRICPALRRPDASRFVCSSTQFTIEQGVDDAVQRVDLSVSINGGQSYSNVYSQYLNERAHFQNRMIFWLNCAQNTLIHQFRFYSTGRFVVSEGVANIYQ